MSSFFIEWKSTKSMSISDRWALINMVSKRRFFSLIRYLTLFYIFLVLQIRLVIDIDMPAKDLNIWFVWVHLRLRMPHPHVSQKGLN